MPPGQDDKDFDWRRSGQHSPFNRKQKEFRSEYENERNKKTDYTVRETPTGFDYYRILGCAPNASQEKIKEQFRQLAFKLHPDSQPPNASKK